MPNLESEFQLIQRYFKKDKYNSLNITKGIGDDAAVINISARENLIVSMDTLISGVHFPVNTNPYDIGHKSLAVNLSDLAAMGATPAWFTLALTLPENNSDWISEFSRGLFEIAKQHGLDLVGGDTTQGPLSITIQIAGYVDNNKIMYRHGAQINDDIYVSGTIGDAGAGLIAINKPLNVNKEITDYLISRLNKPIPRVSLGKQIRQYSSACIDISDGLLADLKHITESSFCGAIIDVDLLPVSTELKNARLEQDYYQLALGSGDDYELCFCASEKNSNEIQLISSKLNIPVTKIGKIIKGDIIKCSFKNEPYCYGNSGYEHFKK